MSAQPQEILEQAFAHRAAGKLDQAIDAYRRAIDLGARTPAALSNLGEALNEAERSSDAIAPLRQAIELDARFAPAWSNLAVAMLRQGQLDDGIKVLERAVGLAPQSPRLHLDLGLALLTRGDWARGFDECEWRWQLGDLDGVEPQVLQIPAWNGSPLRGQTILLHTEQGLGDSILFARYVPMVAQRGGKITLSCEPTLRRLFERIPGVESIRATGEPLPHVDVRCSLPSLPRIFETRPTRVPANIPYLHAPSDAIERWKSKLADDRRFRVGICWSGKLTQAAHRFRRVPPQLLAPLAAATGVTFYNLQKDAPPTDLAATGFNLIDHTAELTDLAETAALMMNLDLVISSDTVVPHLAAAVGKPTWTMLPFAADWRWMRGATTPWFPAMRLFRQPAPGLWQPVIEQVAAALEQHAQCAEQSRS